MDPVPSVSAAYAGAAGRQGVELDVAVVRDRFRRAFGDDEVDEQRGPLATDEDVEHRRWRRIVAACLPEIPDPDRAFDELWEHFGRPSSWRAYPDAAPALERLAEAGLSVVVASNFDGRLRPVLRGMNGLGRWAETAVISSEVGRRKPHADFYRAACGRLNLAPESVLCVGDDPENDLNGPQRAGLRAVLIHREGMLESERPALRSLNELITLLGVRSD